MPRHRNEDTIIVKHPTFWQRRTLLELILFALVVFAVIVISALIISLYALQLHSQHNHAERIRAEALRRARSDEQPVLHVYPANAENASPQNSTKSEKIVEMQDICQTPECIKAASKMMDNMDESVDPCTNFYEFACGNYIKNTPIPSDKVLVDSFSVVRDLVQDQLQTIINEPPKLDESNPFKLAKNYNLACLNKSIIETRGIKPLADILESYGGWPVVKGDLWSPDSWNWFEVIKKFRRMGLDTSIIFTFSVSTNLKNSTVRVLDIDQTDLGLSREFLIKGIDEKFVKAYYDFMVDNAVIFGADKKRAEDELLQSLELEMKLANISLPNEERRNATALYNPVTIKELQESYPYLNWLEYINAMLPNGLDVEDDEVVINSVPTFFAQLGEIFNSTSKRTMANYFLWRVVLTTSGTLNNQLRQRKLEYYKAVYGLQGEEERWKECVTYTSVSLPVSVGALYVRKYFDENSRREAIELVDNIREEFINILHRLQWMDDNARSAAIEKAKVITNHVGYPNELADNNKLEEFFADLSMEPDNLLLNTLRLNVFSTDLRFNKLRVEVNKTSWETHSKPATVNAFYSSLENSIQFPAAILQGNFFAAKRPKYMNYAAIGQIMGHEITHGFDDRGRQFDSDGNLADWWDSETQKNFVEKAKCIIEQYGNYTDLKTNLSLNGINTQGENIADNGGLKEAYLAYQSYVKKNGPEGTLPGLKYNQNQLFWLSYGQVWCSVARDEYQKNKITTGVHSTNEWRVNGAVSNLREFSFDFNCPERTKMNPSNKCEVW